MFLVQSTPSGDDGLLVAELGCRGRAAELDERGVGAVAKVEEVRVDRSTLPEVQSKVESTGALAGRPK